MNMLNNTCTMYMNKFYDKSGCFYRTSKGLFTSISIIIIIDKYNHLHEVDIVLHATAYRHSVSEFSFRYSVFGERYSLFTIRNSVCRVHYIRRSDIISYLSRKNQLVLKSVEIR